MTSSLLRALAGDPDLESLFSDQAEIQGILSFEAALGASEAAAGIIPKEASTAIETACRNFVPDLAVLGHGIAKDGVVVPALVAALRKAIGEPHGQWLHFQATSQDAVDTSLVLRLKQACVELDVRVSSLVSALELLRSRNGKTRLLAQTRMQRALPFTAAEKIETWLRPLQRNRQRLEDIRPLLLVVQFGGAVGTRNGLDGKGDVIAADLAKRLGLTSAPVWHTARDLIVEFGSWLSLVSGTLGKIGADVALMAQNEVGTVRIAGGGGSSAMPHKSNPVSAEILVALARFNASMVGALHQSLIHENERSGAAWTLEWLVLPQMVIATGAALRHATALIRNLEFVADDKIY